MERSDIIYFNLEKRKAELEKTISICTKNLASCPEGRLRISKTRNRIQYYEVTAPNDNTGKYIRKKDIAKAEMLACKEYYCQLLSKASKELKIVNQYLGIGGWSGLAAVYEEMNEYRRDLVSPLFLPDDEYQHLWESEKYEGKSFDPNFPVFLTKKNERVRSKSEVLIADKLTDMGIPYKYEHPLRLPKYGIIYPDFTILNVVQRKEIYYEHFGQMDSEEYLSKFMAKIKTYYRHGITPGNGLIMTFETLKSPLDIRNVEQLIRGSLGI